MAPMVTLFPSGPFSSWTHMASTDYLLPAEMPTYYDTRRVLQLLVDSDSGAPAALTDLSNTNSVVYQQAARLIRTISADIDSRCQVGKRYDRTDLETMASDARDALISDPAYDAKWKRFSLLQQLVADLLWGVMNARRGMAADELKRIAPRYDDALIRLEKLYEGVAVFDLDGPKDSGVPSIVTIGQNRITSTQFSRLFGIWPDSTGIGGFPVFTDYPFWR